MKSFLRQKLRLLVGRAMNVDRRVLSSLSNRAGFAPLEVSGDDSLQELATLDRRNFEKFLRQSINTPITLRIYQGLRKFPVLIIKRVSKRF